VSSLIGKHVLVELYGCDRARLDDETYLRSRAVAAAEAAGATVVAVHAHRFRPVGVSVVVVLAESHLALHTWPERGVASADIFVCGPDTDPHRAKRSLIESLHAARAAELEIDRGRLEPGSVERWHQIELVPVT
jgi:S-adenosylmethionine decarboxylase